METIRNQIYMVYKQVFNKWNFQTTHVNKLHKTAIECLGQDVGDSGYGDEVDCAISVNNVNFRAFNDFIGGDISTTRMYLALLGNKKWIEVSKPLAGDVVISPTQGKRTGHVGIFSYGDSILSNNSETGLFDAHWRLDAWKKYYGKKGLPTYYFRRISV